MAGLMWFLEPWGRADVPASFGRVPDGSEPDSPTNDLCYAYLELS